MRGPESCFAGRQPVSNSCAVQAACALLMQPLCALSIVGIVTHVHVRHARRDAGLQHVALCAPLEWPGCMDQQVHILQVWSRIRCVAAGRMCAPCIRGSHSRRPADTHRETAAVRTCTFSAAASEAASSMSHCRKRVPFSSGRPSISFSYPAGRRPDSEMSTSAPSCRHVPPLSPGHQDANENAAAMRLCSAAHLTYTDLVPCLSHGMLQTSVHAIVAMASVMADCCLPPPVSAMLRYRSQLAPCRQAQARDAACRRCCRCWRTSWKRHCHLCHLAAGFH
jgi:hypothetical protein